MVLGSTQALVKMSNRNIPGVKGGRCVRLITSPPSCAECLKISWNLLGYTGLVMGRRMFNMLLEGKNNPKEWR
jgi:hypothetical protein